MSKIYIYGASGHGHVIAEIAMTCHYKEIVFIDDGDNPYPHSNTLSNDAPIVLAIGNNKTRAKIYHTLIASGFEVISLIHPSAIISASATIENGTVVMAGCVINADAKIGKGVILNTSCVIEHQTIIEDFVHISPKVALAGDVFVGELSHVGIGSVAIQGIRIGAESIIGAGSVIVRNIPAKSTAYGNPCRVIKKSKDA
ncbi:MAG: acetyltransferase [Sulfurimonadaceae bacterium]|nr:acetyltransferase [Sulfurimonadaceae bacterium]